MFLSADQARYIYKKVEQEGIVNIGTIKKGIQDDRLDKDNIDNKEEVNPYQNIMINELDREDIITSQRSSCQYLVILLIMYSMTGLLEIFII